MGSSIRHFIKDETGQGVLEYAGVMVFGCMLAYVFVTQWGPGLGVQAQFANIVNGILGWLGTMGS